MSKKTILLYQPKIEEIDIPPRDPPLSLLAISGLLLEAGYEVKIFDAMLDKSAQDKILENLDKAICVGLSVWMGYAIKDSLDLCKKIRQAKPKIPIVWGGWHPTLLPEQSIKNPYIDIIVRGQGESTFLELVKILEKKGSLSKIKGITYKLEGRIINNPNRPRTPLDDIPPMPYNLIDVKKYLNNTVGKKTIAYISSQGCPNGCTFCIDTVLYGHPRMELSAERVLADLKNLIENYGVDSFMFVDTNFFFDKNKVRKICKGIIDNQWNIQWTAFERANNFLTFNDEDIKIIKKSGCKLLGIGAESGSQRILDLLNKGLKVEEIIAFTKLCKKHNIGIRFDFIVGLPYETREDFKKTLSLIKEVYRINKNNELHLPFYTPYPKTALYNLVVKKYGFEEPKSLEEWISYDPNFSEMKWVSKQYRQEVQTFLFYLQLASLNDHFQKRINQSKFKLPYLLMHKISSFRVNHNFFRIPLEKRAYDLFKIFF